MSNPAQYVLLPSHIDGLLVGALLAIQARSTGGLRAIWIRSLVLAGTSGFVIAVLTLIAWHLGSKVREQNWTQVPLYTATAFLGGSVLIQTVTASPAQFIKPIFAHPILRSFGKYSYAIYLFNKLAEDIFLRITRSVHWPRIGNSRLPEQLGRDLSCTAIVFAAAWLSWHLWEVHFLKLKRFFPSAASDPSDLDSLHSGEAATQTGVSDRAMPPAAETPIGAPMIPTRSPASRAASAVTSSPLSARPSSPACRKHSGE